MNQKYLIVGAIGVAAIAAFSLLRPNPAQEVAQVPPLEGSAIVAVNMPVIGGNAAVGQGIFNTVCAACHGTNAVGIEGVGPPLIHVIYEPSHHADEAFQRAVAVGVRSHHWGFGDMAPVNGLTRGDVTMIVAYIREIQRANGIN